MSRKIIGITVGTQLPKPNFKQTDPTKGDYIKNKPDFEGLKAEVDTISDLVGNTEVSTQIASAVSSVVRHDSQTLTEDQMAQARANIGAISSNDLSDAMSDQINTHNASTAAHNDIRSSIKELEDVVNGIEIPTKLSDLAEDSTHRVVTDEEKAAWNAKSDFSGNYNDLTNKPSIPSIEGLATEGYVNSQIAAIPTPDVSGQINTHNTSTGAHNDIRLLIDGLTSRLNALANSTDEDLDQMAEVVAYIKSNKSLIDSITTSKVNVADIIDNLTTNVSNKPLSAAQGVALKALIDALQTEVDGKALSTDLTSHSNNKSNPHGVTKEQVGLGNVEDKSSATIRGELTKSNVTTALGYTPMTPTEVNTALGGKSDTGHGHEISDVTNLQPTLDAKATQSSLDSHTGNTTVHITSTERNNWNAAKTHADSAHAPSNAQANQNAFSNITVGSTTIAADTTTDTLTLVAGNNVTITPDATNDKITIAATDTVYTHPTTAGNKHIPSGGSSGQVLTWSSDGTAVWGTAGASASGKTATLSASSWTAQADGSYGQTVSVSGVTTSNQIAVDCSLTGSDKDANIAILQGWGCVNDCKQAAGTLTFYCYGDKPTVNIPINVVVM